MKKIILLSLFSVFCFVSNAYVYKTVNVTTAGTLTNLLTQTEKNTVAHLTLSGNIDARDIKLIRDNMPNLMYVYFSGSTIKAYSGYGGTENGYDTYPANELPAYAFYNRSSIYMVTLPVSLIRIGASAFENCTKMNEITIPQNVIGIEARAFAECENLSYVYTLPSSLQYYGISAFENCVNLSSITIPSSIDRFQCGPFVFNGCSGLTSIYANSTTPLFLMDPFGPLVWFDGVDKPNCELYVPIGTISLYQNALEWEQFLNIYESSWMGQVKRFNSENNSDKTLQTIKIFSSNCILKIVGVKKGYNILVFNLLGKTVFNKISNGEEVFINLPKSIYLVKINNETYKVLNE